MSKIQELDILAKYLDEDELKEIAKSAAYDLFKSSIAPNNKYQKQNIEYWCTQGAMMAMREQIEPIRCELQQEYNKRVLSAVKKISLFDLQYKEWSDLSKIINLSLEPHSEKISERINKILSESYYSPEKENNKYSDELYKTVHDFVGEIVSEIVDNSLKLNYSKDNK